MAPWQQKSCDNNYFLDAVIHRIAEAGFGLSGQKPARWDYANHSRKGMGKGATEVDKDKNQGKGKNDKQHEPTEKERKKRLARASRRAAKRECNAQAAKAEGTASQTSAPPNQEPVAKAVAAIFVRFPCTLR